MRLLIKIIFLAAGMYLLSTCALASKIQPSHVATIGIPVEDYANFVGRLDGVVAQFGLQKFKASPGLNDLVGRDVLYFEYKKDRAEKTGFLVVTDIKKASELEIRIFDDYFSDPNLRSEAVTRIISFIDEYKGVVIIRN